MPPPESEIPFDVPKRRPSCPRKNCCCLLCLGEWHPITSFTNEDATVAAIRANAPKSGIYLMPSGQTAPGADKAASEKAMRDRMKTGPVIFASMQAQGMGDNYAMFFVTGALIDFAGALFI